MELNLYLISDSTGETLDVISRAVVSQFPDVVVNKNSWFLVRTRFQIEQITNEIIRQPGIVLYTFANKELEELLSGKCREISVPNMSILTSVVNLFATYLKIPSKSLVASQHNIEDKDYQKRIEAINYTIAHDDGNFADISDLEEADIVIIGPSRTSKSPVSVYLSYKGFKVANIPFVPPYQMPDLGKLRNPLVVGFVISSLRLEEIRRTRMKILNSKTETDYTDMEKIQEELILARKLYQQLGCPVLDVTQKSVEETAVYIVSLLKKP